MSSTFFSMFMSGVEVTFTSSGCGLRDRRSLDIGAEIFFFSFLRAFIYSSNGKERKGWHIHTYHSSSCTKRPEVAPDLDMHSCKGKEREIGNWDH